MSRTPEAMSRAPSYRELTERVARNSAEHARRTAVIAETAAGRAAIWAVRAARAKEIAEHHAK